MSNPTLKFLQREGHGIGSSRAELPCQDERKPPLEMVAEAGHYLIIRVPSGRRFKSIILSVADVKAMADAVAPLDPTP